jgi:exodeoxyribonuclease VII large subunit
MARALAAQRDRLARAGGRRVLTDPARPLRELARRLDDARTRLRQAALSSLDRRAHRVELAERGLRSLNPVARTLNGRRALIDLRGRLERGVYRNLDRARHRLGAEAGRLDSLSPLAVLGRGYSLTRTADGRIVRTWRDVRAGVSVNVLLHEGSLDCRVDATRERDDRPQV